MSTNKNDIQYNWNVNDIYENWEEWQKDFDKISNLMDEIAKLKGTIKDAESLIKILDLDEELNILSYKVYRYPQLQRDVNSKDDFLNQKFQEVGILFSKFSIATSWLTPEMLTIPQDTMMKWIDENKEKLEKHRFSLMDMYRLQKHVLDEEKEKLLSYYSQFRGTPQDIYTALSVTDIEFPIIKLSDNTEVKLTRGEYSKILNTNRNREDRKKAYENFNKVFLKNKNTYAAIYKSILLRGVAGTKARNYNSTLEAALEGNNIPVAVYETLINSVKENTEPLKKYRELRKRALKLDEYRPWDSYISLVDYDNKYEYEKAKELVLNSLSSMDREYIAKAKKALNERWIDVYEKDGKRSGAYSAGTYGVHPYMLLNYNETLDSVFTLAHELGHTMHTLLSDENQPFATHGYTIFVAEVASTYNEKLLLDYMLKNSTDPKEKIALLEQAINNIVGTFFTQVMFADFEYQAHKLAENDTPITVETLDNIVENLSNSYYGEDRYKDEYSNIFWTRIPHFYNSPYYVYQYATCFASSSKIYTDIKTNPENLTNYIELLKSGGNDFPMEQLKKAGVDLTKEETILKVVEELDRLVDELEKVLKENNMI
ncbi:MAG: oligopeptidase [Fusobacteriales bacterium]|jgi:oligoendopeptidase F|nr:oligopeptidase [Fusobacteriales bacterium]